MQRTNVHYVFSGSRPPVQYLPTGYENYCLEEMLTMLETALKGACYDYFSENNASLAEIESIHLQMLESIKAKHYEHADVCLGYLMQNNLLVLMAQKLINLQAQSLKDKYNRYPDNVYFEDADKLLAACDAVWREKEFGDAWEALRDNGHDECADKFYPLLSDFKTPAFVAFLTRQMAGLVTQVERKSADILRIPTPRFFKPEMLYLDDADMYGYVVHSSSEVDVSMPRPGPC